MLQTLRETGISNRQVENSHKAFEKNSPEGHQEFLEFLNIPKEEIQALRSRLGQ